ncbi:hypothetical protein Purlil1_5998 [Purpureocillium lilacinum]|uniref:Uncharacterized protein n=1 Tax=Purpureocillium lilacinum TaxID=33203 RepID=A0ABR0C110_PURLI|nr:hypothetical protein Purlil1_5998 [Purpureocillium lilacinum]
MADPGAAAESLGRFPEPCAFARFDGSRCHRLPRCLQRPPDKLLLGHSAEAITRDAGAGHFTPSKCQPASSYIRRSPCFLGSQWGGSDVCAAHRSIWRQTETQLRIPRARYGNAAAAAEHSRFLSFLAANRHRNLGRSPARAPLARDEQDPTRLRLECMNRRRPPARLGGGFPPEQSKKGDGKPMLNTEIWAGGGGLTRSTPTARQAINQTSARYRYEPRRGAVARRAPSGCAPPLFHEEDKREDGVHVLLCLRATTEYRGPLRVDLAGAWQFTAGQRIRTGRSLVSSRGLEVMRRWYKASDGGHWCSGAPRSRKVARRQVGLHRCVCGGGGGGGGVGKTGATETTAGNAQQCGSRSIITVPGHGTTSPVVRWLTGD